MNGRSLAMLAASVATMPAGAAQDAGKAPTAQQECMKTCAEHAAGMKGDERKKFMSECLKG